MGWEDQGRQDHGWFGTDTSGGSTEESPRPASADDLGRLVAATAASRLPARARAEFEDFTGRDGGKTLLRAMRVWADGSHLTLARFRALLVGQGMTEAGATSLQAMARGLAAPHDPAALAQAGEHLATALRQTVHGDLRYALSYAQDKAVYADVNGLVPDRPAPGGPAPVAQGAAGVAAGVAVAAAPEGAGPWLMAAGRFAVWALSAGGAPLVGATILFWPTRMGDGTMSRSPGAVPGGGAVPPVMAPLQGFPPLRPSEATPDKNGSILYSKPSGGDGEKPRAGTHDQPPTGSKPIDETPWSGNHGEIKQDIIAGGKDDVRISPDGDV